MVLVVATGGLGGTHVHFLFNSGAPREVVGLVGPVGVGLLEEEDVGGVLSHGCEEELVFAVIVGCFGEASRVQAMDAEAIVGGRTGVIPEEGIREYCWCVDCVGCRAADIFARGSLFPGLPPGGAWVFKLPRHHRSMRWQRHLQEGLS